MKSSKVKKHTKEDSKEYITVSKKRWDELLKVKDEFKKHKEKSDKEKDVFNNIFEMQENQIKHILLEKREINNSFAEYREKFEGTMNNLKTFALKIEEEEKKAFDPKTNVGLYINLLSSKVYLDDFKIDLTPQERKLLYIFASHNYISLNIQDIYDLITYNRLLEFSDVKRSLSYDTTVTKYINRLRETLGKRKKAKVLLDGINTKFDKEYAFYYSGNIKLIDENGNLI
ncbi:MAG: hypothetical protein NTY74_04150 [Ignavibacteriae bacterium]|nr:hypothetical protein [Ignavibacteriota bacterium]